MSKPKEEIGFPEYKSPLEDERILWIMVLTPLALAFGLVAGAVLLGPPRLDAALLLAGGPVLPAIQLSEELQGSSYEETSDCLHTEERNPWAGSAVVLGNEFSTGAYPACEQLISSSGMTVGQRGDEEGTTLGNGAAVASPIGEMNDTELFFWGRDHAANGLSYLEAADSSSELTLDADWELPVGEGSLLLPDETHTNEETSYTWSSGTDRDWADGQGLEVVLFHNPWLETEHERVW